MSKLKVMLATEGTYPFHQGGVSTWCDIMVRRLTAVDFVIYSVLMNPFVTQKFSLPDSASLVRMPLWGTEEPCEHLTTPFSDIYRMKKRTTPKVVQEHFIPLFEQLVRHIVDPVKKHHEFGMLLLHLNEYFQEYEYKESFKSETAWGVYKDIIASLSSARQYGMVQPDLYGMIQSLGWVYRFLNIINTPVPKVHVTHASAAAFCGIPCVLAKLRDKTPYMLTEHGVYLREQYLSLSKRGYSPYLGTFLIRFIHSITGLNYAFADQVSPVCQYNTRWEVRFGVKPEHVKVIYNGVDQHVFQEDLGPPKPAPTVVMVARIDPIKDILTFLKAAQVVRESVPDAKFIVYGSVSVESYYEECLELRKELQLEDGFIFAGHTSQMSAAYQSGDIIVLSSISEAFPYSVVEAMMTGKPVVATDVGGVREALGDTGILVHPRSPEQLAEGMVRLLSDPELRYEMGRDGRQRALDHFTLDRVLELHLKSYIKLAVHPNLEAPAEERFEPDRSRFYLEKGLALAEIGAYEAAVMQYRKALSARPASKLAPVVMMELAKAYNRLGKYDLAFQEMERCQAYISALETVRHQSA